MSKKHIFVSCVHPELDPERESVRNYIARKPEYRDAFELVESGSRWFETPGEPPDLEAVSRCDLFVAIIGNKRSDGSSNLEAEIDSALSQKKLCLILVKGLTDTRRDSTMVALIRKVATRTQYRRFRNKSEFHAALRDALLPHLQTLGQDNDGARYRVFFTRNPADVRTQLSRPAIVFSPTIEPNNELRIYTRFHFELLSLDTMLVGEILLAFVESGGEFKSPKDKIENLLASQPPGTLLAASDLPEFYTLLPNMQSYRQVIQKMGLDRAKDFLSEMNDLVVLNRSQARPAWFESAMNSNQFNFSFMTNYEAFFALKNAASLLGGLEFETLSGMSSHLQLSFQLPVFTNPHELKFNFEHDGMLPKRIAVMIGKNGVGKSQALSHFVKFLLEDDTGGLQDLETEKSRPSINRLLAVSSPGETYKTFPQPPRFPGRINYRRIFLSRRQLGNKQLGFGDVLVELSRSEESIKEKGRWNLFCDAVSPIVPLDQVFVQVRKGDRESNPQWLRKPFPLSELQEGGLSRRLERWSAVDPQEDLCRVVNGNVLPLSSGELTFIRFAAQACLYIENGTMVLIDEPEIHLHPNLVSEFVGLLDKLLADTGSFAIIATHSAYFVREVPGSQVIILSQEKPSIITATSPRLKTLGADIGAISSFVFGDSPYGDDSFGNIFSQLKQKLQQAGDAAPAQLKALADYLPAEAIMYLRRAIAEKPKV